MGSSIVWRNFGVVNLGSIQPSRRLDHRKIKACEDNQEGAKT
jgi:hypothetical protein